MMKTVKKMNSKVMTVFVGLLGISQALAHPGPPGHSHGENGEVWPFGDFEWAPLVITGLIVAALAGAIRQWVRK
ncbi:MAG: hypothetical protein ACQKBY_02240 [Verrucomicrobiales bacterium]